MLTHKHTAATSKCSMIRNVQKLFNRHSAKIILLTFGSLVFGIYWLWHEGVIIYSLQPQNQTFDIVSNPVCTFRQDCKDKLIDNYYPPCLVGSRKIIYDKKEIHRYIDRYNSFETWPMDLESLMKAYNYIDTKNGIIQPQTCKQNVHSRVAIIIPYRNRPEQLKLFLTYMIPMLVRQEIVFKLYIIEQHGETTFNRARLLNAGFEIAKKEYNWDCYMFHDVDLVAENDHNLYRCHDQGVPQHFLVAWSKYNYLLRYQKFFGGVVQVSPKVYQDANGHSNEYWGWGGEDDDFYERVVKRSEFSTIFRPDSSLARYKMVPHIREKSNSVSGERYDLLENFDRENDGLSNLKYEIVDSQVNCLFEKIVVNISN